MKIGCDCTCSLNGTLATVQTLSGGLSITPGDIPAYAGPYEVTPTAYMGTLLDTAGKKMMDDVTVYEIPYYETSNLSGGMTAIIG